MLAFVSGVVGGGGEGSCDQVFDAMSKVQSSELGLWLSVSQCCLGQDEYAAPCAAVYCFRSASCGSLQSRMRQTFAHG
jgi:hypothetical protein